MTGLKLYVIQLLKYLEESPKHCTFSHCEFCLVDSRVRDAGYKLDEVYCLIKEDNFKVGVKCSCKSHDFLKELLEVL